MKKTFVMGAIVCALFVFVGQASAHVTLNPREAAPGYNTFVVRVPNEKDVPTVSVRVVVPDGADITGIKPVPGWTYTVMREEGAVEEEDGHGEGAGRITEITWSGMVGVGEFQEFPISVRYTGEPATLTWNAYQTYQGGDVVPWDGSDEGHPAPAVKFVAAGAPSAGASTTAVAAATTQSPWLSVVAVVLSVAALAMSMKKK